MLAVILYTAIAVSRVLAQTNFTSGSETGAYDNDVLMCDTTFARANGTGIYSFDPQEPQGTTVGSYDPNAPAITWALTVSSQLSRTSPLFGTYIDLLFNTGGANYTDDIHLGYDVCAFLLNPEALYDNTIARGQSDNGSCLMTFDNDCANALAQSAANYASWIDYPSPRPNSNLTSDSLPTVCSDIMNLMRANLPAKCQPFINATGPSYMLDYFPMTEASPSKNLSAVPGNCPVNGTGFGAYRNIETYSWAYYSDDLYDYLSTLIAPIITIYMPTANAEVSSANTDYSAFLTCLHVDHFNQGSRVAPALPSATPVNYGGKSGLSGGAIAGIVIGCVVGVALIVLATLFFFNCRGIRDKMSKKKASTPEMEQTRDNYPAEKQDTLATTSRDSPKTDVKSMAGLTSLEVTGDGLNEMSPQSYRTNELPSPEIPRSELPGGDAKHEEALFGRTELPGSERKFELEEQQGPVEMPADSGKIR